MKKLYFLFTALMMGSLSFGQTTVFAESFESGNSGTPSEVCNDTANDFFTVTDGSDISGNYAVSGQDGSFYFAAQDTDGAPCSSSMQTLVFDDLDISTFSNLTLAVLLAEDDSNDGNEDWDSGDLFYIEVDYDNSGTFTKVIQFAVNGSTGSNVSAPMQDTDFDGVGEGTELTPTFTEFTASLGTGSLIDVRLVFDGLAAGDEDIAVDNIRIVDGFAACGVSFGTEQITCSSSTIGDNNDGVTISIPYTGSDVTITSVTTTSSGTIGGDDPSGIVDGTITITGLSEGDAWDLTLVGGNCDGNTISGTVGNAICDPAPNTCFDLSTGSELFEIVTVAANSDGDVWSESSGTYSINGFCGGGCMEETNGWLVFGPLDMSGVSDLALAFDASENFDGSELNIQYTSDYSSLCPSSATWTSAQTIDAAGSYSVDLSSASGTDVFVGVQYQDADGSFSSWSISNVNLVAFGSCPSLGSRPTSNCASCDVVLQTENYVCNTNTVGDNNDTVTIEIPYSGSEDTITSITTTSGGTIGGDDPSGIADGTITITGLTEGSTWDLTINGGDCDGTTISGTVPSAACDPVTTDLVINEILADPASGADPNGDGNASTSEDEFVELYNIGATDLDISGYTIEDGFTLRHTFPASTIIPAGGFMTVFGAGTPTGIPGLSQASSTGSLGLNNGGDTVTIRNAANAIVVTESYTGASDQSVCREPDFTGAFVGHLSHATNPVEFSPGRRNDQVLSNNRYDATSFSIFPNPTNTGVVTITSSVNEDMNVQVFDLLGKQVKNETLTNNTLNVSNLKTGIYLVKITQNNATVTKKLVIK